MPLTLIEAAKLEQDLLRRGVIQTFAETSPVLEDLPFTDVQGNSLKFNIESKLPNVAFREVNVGYTESTGEVRQASETLKIYGGTIDVDRYIQQTRGSLNDQRAVQTRLKVKALSLGFTRAFFHGDSTTDVNSFDGLAKRITGDQIIEAGTNGAALTLDLLDDLIDRVNGGPDVLYMNRKMRRQVTKLARSSAILRVGQDDFGRQVVSYDGIPIKIIDVDEHGNQILDFTETTGTSSKTASIYAVRYGAEEYLGGITNGGIQVVDAGLQSDPPVYRTLVEWYVSIVLYNPNAAARLKGVIEA